MSVERGMRGPAGGLHRRGGVHHARGLGCAPSPESATLPPGKGTSGAGHADPDARNGGRVFGVFSSSLEG